MCKMERIAAGNTAEILDYGDGRVCKLFFAHFPEICPEKEYKNMKLVNTLGIPSPKVYGQVEIDGRYGIVEEKLSGETILSQMIQGRNVPHLIKEMTDLQKRMLSCHTRECICYKDSLRGFLEGKLSKTHELYRKIEELPEGDCVCHGDYHPDNVWQKPDGELYVIDFANICYGPREYDIARSYFLMIQGEAPRAMSESDKAELQRMRMELGKAYLMLMDSREEELRQYIDVIAKCREYEMQI